MPIFEYLAFSMIGTLLWTTGLATAGYILGQAYEVVADYVDPVSIAVLAVLTGWYLVSCRNLSQSAIIAGAINGVPADDSRRLSMARRIKFFVGNSAYSAGAAL